MSKRFLWRVALVLVGAAILGAAAVAFGGGRALRKQLTAWYVTSQTSRRTSIPPVAEAGVRIPFEWVSKHVFLQVTVDGSRPLRFILDSGDRWAVIDLDRAKELGIRLGGSVTFKGVGSQLSTGAFVGDASFSLPGLAGFSQPVNLALPLRGLAPRFGRECDGIVGSELLRLFVVEIDYGARMLTLHDKDRFAYSGPGERLSMRLDAEDHPIVEAEVTPLGGEPIRGDFLVDIGAGESLVLYSPFAAAHHLPGPGSKTLRALARAGTGGESTGRLGRVAELKIGGLRLRNPVALFSSDQAGAYANPDLLGSIGSRLVSQFKLFLDYPHHRIILEPVVPPDGAIDPASSGLGIEAEGSDYRTFRITEVLESSPGSEAGLQSGDVIAGIDERPASDLTLSELQDLFERPVGYRVTIRRGAQTLHLILTPRRLV